MKPADAAPVLAYTERILVEAGLVGENTGALKRSNKRGELMRERIVLPLSTIQQYALSKFRAIDKSGENKAMKEVYEKLIMRSSFGIINAARNSA